MCSRTPNTNQANNQVKYFHLLEGDQDTPRTDCRFRSFISQERKLPELEGLEPGQA